MVGVFWLFVLFFCHGVAKSWTWLNDLHMPGEPQGQRSLAAYSPWHCKELDMTERLNNDKYKDR